MSKIRQLDTMNIAVSKVVESLINMLRTNNICTTEEKRLSVAREMFWSFTDSELEQNDLKVIQSKIKVVEFTFTQGNLWTQLDQYFRNPKYIKFFRLIFNMTPVGLNTSPNACCGKGELMYRLLRPLSSQPKKGDIQDGARKLELKGSETRISSQNITGKQYASITRNALSSLISGNTVSSGSLKDTIQYEIEKGKNREHYSSEFAKLEFLVRKNAMIEIFKGLNIDVTSSDSIDTIVAKDFNQELYQRTLLADFYSKYKKQSEFDTLIFFGDGTNVKMLSSVADLDKVVITNDYFRIAQSANIGWYIK